MSILIYAFSNQWGTNISRRTLLELEKILPSEINFQLVRFHPQSFFNKYIKNNHHDLIIGLGDFYGPITKIRLETITHNNYLNKTISPFSPINLEISLPSLDNLDTKTFTVSERMGNYNCNWIVYSTELYIRDHSPHTRQLFFHLPKRLNASLLASQIFELLINNQLI